MAESILAVVVQHGSANVEEGLQRSRRSCEVMAISRPDGLGDIAALGLTMVAQWRRSAAQSSGAQVYNGALGAGFGHRFDRIAKADPALAQAE
jgi:hypothetical protein